MSHNAGAVLDAAAFCRLLTLSIKQAVMLAGDMPLNSVAACDSDACHQLLCTELVTHVCRSREGANSHGQE